MFHIDIGRSGAVRFLMIAIYLMASAIPALAQDDGTGTTTVHIVQSGDTIFGIAERYGISFDAIIEANDLDNPGLLFVGQRLLIPNAQPPDGQIRAPSNAPSGDGPPLLPPDGQPTNEQILPPSDAPQGDGPPLLPPIEQSTGVQPSLPPGEQTATGSPGTHIVGPGDTLEGLLARYNTTREAFAAANNLCNPRLLYIGQRLIVPQETGADGQPSNGASGAVHTVRPGQNLFRLAVQYGTTVNELVRANNLNWPSPVFFGQTLRIPAASAGERAEGLPYPVASLAFSPLPVVQGKTLSITLVTDGAATASGSFLDRPLHFASSGNQHYALIGAGATMPPGIYPLTLEIETSSGQRTDLTMRVAVQSGGYQTEEIELYSGQEDLLDPAVTAAEDALIAGVTGGFTPTRYFDGPMTLPSSGLMTSEFGTRRSYNHGELNSFHSGTDFGAWPGTPIAAPAAGVVVMTESLAVRGNATIIDHGWGVYSGFWHQAEINVNVGDVVEPGQAIGLVGSTGRSTGPHLHWELWVGGAQVDPLQWAREAFP